QPRFLLLDLWVAVAILTGAALLEVAVSAYRILIIFPAVATLAAVGATTIVEVGERQRVLGHRAALALLAGVALVVSVVNINYYFRDSIPSCAFPDTGTRMASRMGSYLAQLDHRYTAYVYGGSRHAYGIYPSVDFLTRKMSVKNVDEFIGPVL